MAGNEKLIFTVAGIETTLDVFVVKNVDESTTDDDVSSLIEELHLNYPNFSDVEREAVIEVIRRRRTAFSLTRCNDTPTPDKNVGRKQTKDG
ncbi:unnamed protein product [Clavelina lepadiformis]|uniref:Uncharacterized protein n=1 Tax=Clavelina lepadiformis TaxID=159417 RepID=A0ABP0F0A7_CLALP